MKRLTMILIATVIAVVTVSTQQENSLTRDEVALLKKKLVAVFDAVDQPPQGYTKTEESFSLPTDAYKDESGHYRPAVASAQWKFGSASEKKAEKSSEQLQKEYEKKILEAQAKGDYQLMSQLAQEMSQKAGQSQVEAIEGRKEPINVYVQLNNNTYEAIDPDGVVFESPGVIALRFKDDVDSVKGRVNIYLDPVNLKETKKLSKVELKEPQGGVGKKTTVTNVTIFLSGPLAEIEAWAKKITTKKVLAQID